MSEHTLILSCMHILTSLAALCLKFNPDLLQKLGQARGWPLMLREHATMGVVDGHDGRSDGVTGRNTTRARVV